MVGQGGLVAGRKNIHFPDDVQQNAGAVGGWVGRREWFCRMTEIFLSHDGSIFLSGGGYVFVGRRKYCCRMAQFFLSDDGIICVG